MPIVSIKDDSTVYQVNSGEILLDSLQDQGAVLNHGCLSGSCGVCRIVVLEGSEFLAAPGEVEQDTIECVTEVYIRNHGEGNIKGKSIRLGCRVKIASNDPDAKIVIEPLE